MRTYPQALDYLTHFINYERNRTAKYSADTLNLDRMVHLLARLGDPHLAYPTIHIAGTKGKGSTAAMIESVLRAAGYRTGLYTSPHLHTFRERVRVSGELISREAFAACVDAIEPHAAAVDGITWFEIITALGFLHFARSGIDVGVIEVGLGGRFDATNVLTPLAAAITSLSLDHTAWLGDTVEQIAFEKAGIVKPGVPTISAPQTPQALAVVERITAERGSPLTVVGADVTVERLASSLAGQEFRIELPAHGAMSADRREQTLKIPLLGAHQITNAAVALAVLTQSDSLAVDPAAIRDGLARVEWPGRFEIMRRDPPFVIDGAHNADSARKLAATLGEVFPGRRWTVVFGASADKDVAAMLDALLPCVERVIATRAESARAADPQHVADLAAGRGCAVTMARHVAEALEQALETDAPLVATGSLYLVAEAREAWLRRIGAPLPERDAD
jgi:dihydrofolate synthase/folylpolyglutamate synthase